MSKKFNLIGILLFVFLITSDALAQKTKVPKGGKVPAASESSVKVPRTFSVAKPFINSYGVEWHPFGDESLTLTVSGPDDQNFQETFGSDTLPYFDFFDPYGNLRADGIYVYQLTVNPSIDVGTYHKMKSIQDSPARSEIVEEMKSTGELPSEERTQTGSFTFKNQEVIMGDAVNMSNHQEADSDEPRNQKDSVTNDDKIIIGSLCVGFDCSNGESFGFDTLRLKENNLRIKFDDTSTSASFPRNDWQLTANASTNGGAEKFSIDDISGGRTPFTIEAGARSNALYVESDGDVGFGTSNPVVELHAVRGDTPTLRLEQDGSSGWNPQTWDLAGNETNFFLRDVTNGSRLPFRVRPGAKTSSLEIKNGEVAINDGSENVDTRIESDGNPNMLFVDAGLDAVGIGTGSPNKPLHVEGTTTNHDVRVKNTSPSGSAGIILEGGNGISSYKWFANSSNSFGLWDINAGAQRVAVLSNGNIGIGNTSPSSLLEVGNGGATCNGTSWTDGSSREYKRDIVGLSDEDLEALFEVLRKVDIVSYNYRVEEPGTPKRIGMIAEEMPEVLASKDRRGMELGRHVGFLMGIVKALQTQNQKLEDDLHDLKSQMDDLKDLVMNPE